MRENRILEYKEDITNTFLKTVSAYANYGTGTIMFGISDDGTVKGISDAQSKCLDIENRINDSIDPVPEYSIDINKRTSVIKLTVSEGMHKPYLYKSKAYRRNDTATVEADRLELTRLILEGNNMSFEELPSKVKDLEFDILTDKLKSSLKLSSVNEDTLKTLELYDAEHGINIAGELFADKNSFCGTDVVRFGDSLSIILDRETFENRSILSQYDNAVSLYRKYYQYEITKGSYREMVEMIPEEAFREALANSIVHRTWDVSANIIVAMFADRIEITSPGGLPKGVCESDYLSGWVSILRNRIIATVFFRLGLIEKFGTGILKIKELYKESINKPIFQIRDNSIKTVLPVTRETNNLTKDENTVLGIAKDRMVASSDVVELTGFGKSKSVSIINRLIEEGYLRPVGNGRGIKYTKVR